MGFFDRIENGTGRVINAMEVGSKHGLAGAVVGGLSAAAGEAIVQPVSAGLSLIGKGDAADKHYQKKMYDPTAKKVKAREGDFIGAATSLGAGMVSNVLHAPGAIVDTVTGK